MLLAGVVMGKLTLRDISPGGNPPLLSLDHLVDEYRETHLPELARVAVVHEHRDGDIVLGFNSPHTLLCPTPIANDEKREGAWRALWQALTGSERPRDWRTEEIGEWRPAGIAVRQIRTWIEGEKRARGGASTPWTQVFTGDSEPAPATFGRGHTLFVYWGTGAEAASVTIALPTASSGNYWPDEQTPLIVEAEFLALAPALGSVTTDAGVAFTMVEFTLPDRETPTRAFWREHLDHLQRSGAIAAFGIRAEDRRLAVLTADRRSAAILKNVILLDRDDLMVTDTEDGAEGIIFTLLDDPDFGSLMLGDTELGEGDTFTQGDIDDGLLSYTQDGDAGDATADSFTFTAKDSEDEEIREDEDEEVVGGYQVSDNGAATFNITIDASVMG